MSAVAGLRFDGTWRPAQRLALDAFEADRAAGRTKTLLVSPPGSGKTLLGWEVIRRVGGPALVLTPTQTVQRQWVASAARFGAEHLVGTTAGEDRPVVVLTYQSLARLTDADDVLAGLADAQLAAERARATGVPVAHAARELAALDGAALTAHRSARARRVAALTRQVADGTLDDVALEDLLAPTVVARLDALRATGIGCVVLDEAHHLASLWGAVCERALAHVGDAPHVLALTATPVREASRRHAELLDRLHGPPDIDVPTPAVVRDGHLAPFVCLAAFCRPTPDEEAELALRDAAWDALVDDMRVAGDGDVLGLAAWVARRLERRLGDEELTWRAALRRWPDVMTACIRIARATGIATPPGTPRDERHREAPTADDWTVALSDWAVGHLQVHPRPEAQELREELARRLAPLGLRLTRTGIRAGQTDTDRTLMASEAKLDAAHLALAAEARARADGAVGALRAAVVCDAEQREAAALSVLDVLEDWATRGDALVPVAVSGRAVRALDRDADMVCARLGEGWTPGARDGHVVDLAPPPGWSSGRWTEAATHALGDGIDVLVGTRGLLGEGWNAPQLTTLVDLTSATTQVAVEQLRGRPLRLDPDVPGKVATVWDVVCVADLAGGHRDYARFVRRHAHVHAPAADGTIERGVSHVDAALSPTAAPPEAVAEQVTADSLARCADLAAARERWRVGTPYRGVELPAVLVTRAEPAGRVVPSRDGWRPELPVTPRERWDAVARRLRRDRTVAAVGGLGGVGTAVASGVLVAPPLFGVGVLAAVGARLLARRARTRAVGEAEDVFGPRRPLDAIVGCVLDAAVGARMLAPDDAVADLHPREDGSVRVLFPRADPEVAARLTAAVDEAVVDPLEATWWVSRPLRPPGADARADALLGVGDSLLRAWHVVPEHFARARPRREAWAAAHARWFGDGELAGSPVDGETVGDDPDAVTRLRVAWT